MKRLIYILTVLSVMAGFIPVHSAEGAPSVIDTIPYNPLLSAYGYNTKRMIMTDGLVVPVGDTTFGTDTSRVGAVVYNPTDSTFYIWNGYWFPIKGGGESVNLGNSNLTQSDATRVFSSNGGILEFVDNSSSPNLGITLIPASNAVGLASGNNNFRVNNASLDFYNGTNSDYYLTISNTGLATFLKSLYGAPSGDTLAAGFNDQGQLITFDRGSFINNQTTEQAGANFNIGGNGITQGNMTVNGPNLWAPNYHTDVSGIGANVARFFSAENIYNTSGTTWPASGVDIHGSQVGLEINNQADISNNMQNNISGVRGTIYVNGTGNAVVATATGNPYAGVSGVAAAFGNSNYTDVADMSLAYPFTYTQGSYTSFTGTITNFYQLYLQGTVTQNIDAQITNKWGIYQASTYPNRLSGGIQMPIVTASAGYTVTTSNYTVISTSATDVSFTMPDPTTCTGSVFKLVAGAAGGISLSVSYTDYSGTTVGTITAGTAVTIQSDGTIFRQIP